MDSRIRHFDRIQHAIRSKRIHKFFLTHGAGTRSFLPALDQQAVYSALPSSS